MKTPGQLTRKTLLVRGTSTLRRSPITCDCISYEEDGGEDGTDRFDYQPCTCGHSVEEHGG